MVSAVPLSQGSVHWAQVYQGLCPCWSGGPGRGPAEHRPAHLQVGEALLEGPGDEVGHLYVQVGRRPPAGARAVVLPPVGVRLVPDLHQAQTRVEFAPQPDQAGAHRRPALQIRRAVGALVSKVCRRAAERSHRLRPQFPHHRQEASERVARAKEQRLLELTGGLRRLVPGRVIGGRGEPGAPGAEADAAGAQRRQPCPIVAVANHGGETLEGRHPEEVGLDGRLLAHNHSGVGVDVNRHFGSRRGQRRCYGQEGEEGAMHRATSAGVCGVGAAAGPCGPPRVGRPSRSGGVTCTSGPPGALGAPRARSPKPLGPATGRGRSDRSPGCRNSRPGCRPSPTARPPLASRG